MSKASKTLLVASVSLILMTLGTSQTFAQATGGGSPGPCIDFRSYNSSYSSSGSASGADAPTATDPNLFIWPGNWSARIERPAPGTPHYIYDELIIGSAVDDTFFFARGPKAYFTSTSPVIFGTVNLTLTHYNTPDFNYTIYNQTNTSVIASGTFSPAGVIAQGTPYNATISFPAPTITIPGVGAFPLPVGEILIEGAMGELGILELCLN